MTKLEIYESDLEKLNQIKAIYLTLESDIQRGYWLEQFNTLIDGYIEGLKSGIVHEIAIENAEKAGYLITVEKCISCGNDTNKKNLKVCNKCANEYKF